MPLAADGESVGGFGVGAASRPSVVALEDIPSALDTPTSLVASSPAVSRP
jgi:hypothetical protein